MSTRSDPERELQQCQEQCQTQAQHQTQEKQRRCYDDCRKQYQERQQQGRGGGRGGGSQQEEEQQGEQNHPYLFRKERFGARITSPNGNVAVLERFDKRSELLQGLQNYRVTFYEANPNAFMLPNHWDADCICVVVNGHATITLIEQGENQQESKRETHNLRPGDIFRANAGTTFHFVNTDKNQKFNIIELSIPVGTPGELEAFFPAASRNQESYFSALSDEVLQAAFNVNMEKLRRLFQGQNEGQFVRASEEQIRALSERSSEHSSESLPWPLHRRGRRSSRPYNLFNEKARQSNQYGQLYEINPEKYEQLQDLDVQVSYANISKGAMIAPFYNSRATKIAVVVSGTGYFEMACPHLEQQHSQRSRSQQKGTTQYQKASGHMRAGDVVVAPAGHPVVTVASKDQNLEVLCFEISAENNQRIPLAGKNNILSQLEDVAKELSFNMKASEVNEILNQQKETWFFPAQQQGKQHQGYASE